MKKWIMRFSLLALLGVAFLGGYIFNRFGMVLATPSNAETVERNVEISNENFKDVLTEYVGESFAQEVTTEIQKSSMNETVKNKTTTPDSAERPDSKKSATNVTPKNQVSSIKINEGDLIKFHIMSLIQVKNKFDGELNDMLGQAKTEFLNLPSDQRTKENLIKVGLSYMNVAMKLESQADAEIYGIIYTLEQELKKNAYDTNVIPEIKKYYEEQKELQKMFFMSKLRS